jgi:hypothetical protein
MVDEQGWGFGVAEVSATGEGDRLYQVPQRSALLRLPKRVAMLSQLMSQKGDGLSIRWG